MQLTRSWDKHTSGRKLPRPRGTTEKHFMTEEANYTVGEKF